MDSDPAKDLRANGELSGLAPLDQLNELAEQARSGSLEFMSWTWLAEAASVITIGQFAWAVACKTTQRRAETTGKPAAKPRTLDDIIYSSDTWARLRERLESTGRLA